MARELLQFARRMQFVIVSKNSFRSKMAVGAAKIVAYLLRRLKLGEGATLPGRVLLSLHPNILPDLAGTFPKIIISGTNAKTTTTALSKSGLEARYEVISNITGANMTAGIAFCLAERDMNSINEVIGVFEVDEAYVPSMASIFNADVIALLNLSRDQLDRVSEVRMTSIKWQTYLRQNHMVKVIANCDDPLVVYAAKESDNVIWVSAGMAFRGDAQSCPNCGGDIVFEVDNWSCSCGFSKPNPSVVIFEDGVRIFDSKVNLKLKLPGRCNVANAAIGLAICYVMGVDLNEAARNMEMLDEVAGRYKRVEIENHDVRLLLSKNPAGWYEIFDLVGEDKSVVVAINSQIADGKDPSWLWDVPFEGLLGRQVIAAGERAYDLSVRLAYAGIVHQVIKDPISAIRHCDSNEVSYVGNYTAFQQLRVQISDRQSQIANSLRLLGSKVIR